MSRDKYLTEAMGLCWHEYNEDKWGCFKCGVNAYMIKGHWLGTPKGHSIFKPINPDFSTWQGFGTLWEFAIKQEWWFQFKVRNNHIPNHKLYGFNLDLINPDKFADALFSFLKEKDKK